MESIIRQQFELGEDLVARVLLVLLRALQDQDDIALGARSQIQSAAVMANALVTFRAHLIRHDHDRGIAF
jgi:hypothetical protein